MNLIPKPGLTGRPDLAAVGRVPAHSSVPPAPRGKLRRVRGTVSASSMAQCIWQRVQAYSGPRAEDLHTRGMVPGPSHGFLLWRRTGAERWGHRQHWGRPVWPPGSEKTPSEMKQQTSSVAPPVWWFVSDSGALGVLDIFPQGLEQTVLPAYDRAARVCLGDLCIITSVHRREPPARPSQDHVSVPLFLVNVRAWRFLAAEPASFRLGESDGVTGAF